MVKKAFLISPSAYSGKKMLNNAKKILKELNFEPKYLLDITSKYKYYAGDYRRRSKEINLAYKDKETKFIFTIVGGMGAIHTLPYLNYSQIKKSNKTIIGFSDITILLNSIYQKTNANCLHGPNLNKPLNEFHKKTLSCLKDCLDQKNYSFKFKKKDIIKKGYVKGKIIGGNLSLLGRSLGTEFEIDTDNKIIFIEDIRMKEGYVFDILWQLKLSGKFKKVRGVILGHFVNCGNNIDFYLREFFKNFNFPVIKNQPIGHDEPNLTIPIGKNCIIDTKNNLWKISFN